jgi:hypothetical protein
MAKWVDLLEGGVLFQLFLALVVVVTVCFMAIQEREVTPELWTTLWVIIGYFFGTQAVAVARGVLQKHVANLVQALRQGTATSSGYVALNEDLLAGLVWLLERGVIAQGVLVVAVSVTVCYISAIGHVVPRELWAAFGVIIGFFFGTKGTVSIIRDVRVYLESLGQELRPVA